MSVADLLAELRSRDVQVWAEGESLRCSTRAGALTPELREALRQRKGDILDFLRGAAALARQERSIVPLQAHGRGVPIFAVPGHNGDVFCYRALAQRLGGDQPFFGLQPPGLDGHEAPLGQIETLAGRFADEVRAFQPDGPLIVAGFCAGGVVAFELARQLQESGPDVRLLALFGSPYPTFFRPLRRLTHTFRGHMNELASSPGAGFAYIAGKLRQRRLRAEDPVLALRTAVERATIAAIRRYTPGPFAGRVSLFLPSDDWARAGFGALLWRSVARDCDEYRGAGGCNGDNMLTEPNAGVFAELFRQALNRNGLR